MFKHQLSSQWPGQPGWEGFCSPHQINKKSTYGWFIYKHGDDWAFCMPQHGKLDEQLTCGSELCLDYWYEQLTGKEPDHKSHMYLTMSTELIEDATCIWELIGEHPEKEMSHDYWEPQSQKKCWLCFYGTQLGLGGAEKIYLKMTLSNSGE